MMTVPQLRSSRPDLLSEAAGELLMYRQPLAELGSQLLLNQCLSWCGAASEAALRDARRLVEFHDKVVASISTTMEVLLTGADRLERAQAVLRKAEGIARTWGMTVVDSGAVVQPPVGLFPDDTAQALDRERAAWEVRDLVQQALLQAEHADAELATELARVAANPLDSTVVAVADPWLLGVPQSQARSLEPPSGADTTPFDIAGWWQTLSHREQVRLIREQPDLVGGSDGIPARSRDEANRILLAREIERSQAEWAALGPVRERSARRGLPAGGGRDTVRQLNTVRQRLLNLQAVQRALDEAKPGEARQLLLLKRASDEEPDVLAAVSSGDVETAGHVGVLVPGLSTTALNVPIYVTNLSDLRERSEELSRTRGDERPAATIFWLGYTPPQWTTMFDRHASVASTGRADDAAMPLARFVLGLTASAPRPVHVTGTGHSYGSLTFAGASKSLNSGISSLVFAGSPGVGVASTRELKVGGKVLNMRAQLDPVAGLDHFQREFTGPARHTADIPGLTNVEIRGRDLGGTAYGHSQYFDKGKGSFEVLARVIAESGEVVPEKPRPPQTPPPWGSRHIK